MKRRLVVGLVAIFASACSLTRTVPETRYYTLAVIDPPAARLPGPLELGSIRVDEAYATSRMAYRSSPWRLDFYTYHRWAAEPAAIVRVAIRDALEPAVADPEGEPVGLDVHVRRIEEVDAPDGWTGRLVLDVTLRRGGRVILGRTFDESVPAESKTPEAVAAALSRALGTILEDVVVALGSRTP